MPSASSRGAVRRARISRQFRQTHDDVTRILNRRLTVFYRVIVDDITHNLSQAHSPSVLADQIFSRDQWRPLFNATLIPSLRTAAVTGVSFEKEWIESATADKTRQSIASFDQFDSNSLQNTTSDASFKGVFYTDVQKLQSIRESHNLSENSKDFSNFIAQKQPGQLPWPDLPDIGVGMSAELQAETERFLKHRAVGVWSKVSDSVRADLQRAIQIGLKEGDTLEQLTKRVESSLKGYTKHQAQRVARTETTAAMGFGGHAERTELGIPAKEWISTIDNRNRGFKAKSNYDHLTCTGQVVKNEDAFIISGEQLNYPGDVSLGATGGNVIHCRCCSIGAWPKGMLAGSNYRDDGHGTVADPRLPSPEEKITLDRQKQANNYRASNAILIKQLIKETTEAMQKAYAETEKVRQEVAKIHDDIVSSQKKYRQAAIDVSEAEKDLQDARARKAPKPEIDRLTKRRNEAEKTQKQADKDLSAATENVSEKVQDVLKASDPAEIKLDTQSLPPDSPQEKTAQKAADWLSVVLEKKATGPNPPKPKIEESIADRAGHKDGRIWLTPNGSQQTAAHELGHFLETLGNNGKNGKGFLYYRTEGYGPTKSLFPLGPNFQRDEIYWDDKFTDAFKSKVRAAYAGKFYPGDVHSEIISMGLELLFANPIAFALSDPEYFRFIIGIIKGLLG